MAATSRAQLYAGVPDNLATPGLLSIPYSDASLTSNHAFYTPRLCTLQELQVVSRRFLAGLRNPVVSTHFLQDMLVLGVNLLTPDSTDTRLGFVHSDTINAWYQHMVKTGANQTPNTEMPINAAGHLPEVLPLAPPHQNPLDDLGLNDLNPEPIIAQPAPAVVAQNADGASFRSVIESTFCAAFLLRLVTKQATYTNNAWGNVMIGRFKKWYGWNFSIQNPGEVQISSVKDRLDEAQIIKNTWAFIVIKTDQLAGADPVKMSINKYIGITPISYGSMQIQNMFMQCWHKTKIPPRVILEKMHCPQVKTATVTIAGICQNHEPKTDSANPSCLFRIARIINPQYFAGLQTKESPLAMAVLVHLLGKVAAFGENSDPTKMFVMQSLSEDYKVVARNLANRIFSSQAYGGNDDYSEEAKEAFANARGEANNQGIPEINMEDIGMI
uniref:Nucleoprotein n=1 Tax=Dioscorea composita virus 1 TaxID=2793727 RepID=A0A8D9UIQ6_9RHAB|nr:TPA_asm: N [Dioscorea composita virus 1]